MRAYEVLIIMDPRLTDEDVAARAGQLKELFTALGGEVGAVENWGKRRLTYELRKQREGTYLLVPVQGSPSTVREFERQLGLNESVLRFLTTRVVERRGTGRPAAVAEAAPSPEPATEEVG